MTVKALLWLHVRMKSSIVTDTALPKLVFHLSPKINPLTTLTYVHMVYMKKESPVIKVGIYDHDRNKRK